ncbi:DNA polymerase III subunit delta' [Mangrovicella endophytica]|uniref:DNA polymerase III subunit delta' n=1 Tax=Mangrovicella endophytica TaxID=2066697 RepID=UPI001FDF6825|nr:DNA polymerase III subunit delta' [Mangrovicella endophytica]
MIGEHLGELQPQFDDLDGVAPPAATLTFYGQQAQWEAFETARGSDRLHHAWLLQGPRGVGKATLAFAMARQLLGVERLDDGDGRPTFSPEDAQARQIAQGSHPNLIHISRPPADRGGFRTQITIDDIRRLNRFFQATTAAGRWRIAIVDPADDLNRSAANALLKILEEPPERSIFLITSHAPGRLLPTIRSRCRLLRFEPLADGDLAAALTATGAGLGEIEMKAAIQRAGGSVRDALSLVAHGGLEIDQRLTALWNAPRTDWHGVQELADALSARGRENSYDLLLASLLAFLSAEAEKRLAAGDADSAARFASLWQRESGRFREALAYNLDRKQVVLSFFAALEEARGGPLAA